MGGNCFFSPLLTRENDRRILSWHHWTTDRRDSIARSDDKTNNKKNWREKYDSCDVISRSTLQPLHSILYTHTHACAIYIFQFSFSVSEREFPNSTDFRIVKKKKKPRIQRQ